MRRFLFCFLMMFAAAAFAQEKSNTFYAGQFAGPDVATKVTNAQASCSPNTSIPCVIVIDAILAVWPQGSLPGRCAQCIWIDYRAVTFNAAPLTITPGGSFLATDGTCAAPSYAFNSHSGSGFLNLVGFDAPVVTSGGACAWLWIGNEARMRSNERLNWSSAADPTSGGPDTGFSRVSAGVVALGDGSGAGNASGTLNLATINAGTNVLAKRVKASNGTALVTGDFSFISGSFGTTASFSATTGTDQGFNVSIASAGTGQTANPVARLTFHDGTWTNAPIPVCNRQENNAPSGLVVSSSTATTLDMTFAGTPVAGTTYTINCVVMGR